MSRRPPTEPLIAVVGATGTGKSKLAVELAKRFNGEIINGDAMQIYKGLPIITNKISEAEKQGIPHHLLDQIGLREEPWTVSNFRNEAGKTIREIRSRGRLPILVGGTHYYTKAVLFNDYLLGGDGDAPPRAEEESREEYPILEASTPEILAKLREVDPRIASRWHPADRRKIRRSLEIWLQTGKTASQTYYEQSQRKSNLRSEDGVAAKYPSPAYSSLIFWLRAEDDILKKRLDERVESMLSAGLIQEAQGMASSARDLNVSGIVIDKTRGIWISIGYKEIVPYLSALGDDSKTPTELEEIKATCIEAIKSATRHYARRQEAWIRMHISAGLAECDALDTLYPLDGTSLDGWEINVKQPVMTVTESFLAGDPRPAPESLSDMAMQTISRIKADLEDGQTRECRYCGVCDKTLMTEKEWAGHLKSNTHRKTVAGRKRWEAFKAWQARQAVSSSSSSSSHSRRGET